MIKTERNKFKKGDKIIKIDILIKHVNLIIEGLANIAKDKQLSEIPIDKQGEYMQILIIATFLSFIHDIGMEIDIQKI